MRTGVWLIGARGSVATTAIAGAAAIRAGLRPPVGCVAELALLRGVGLPGLDEIVFGGHDVVATDLVKRAEELAESGVLPAGIMAAVRQDLVTADAEIRHGAGPGDGRSQADAIAALVADLTDFRDRNNLARVVVVNVSSTEPPAQPHPAHATLTALRTALAVGETVLPTSAAYAYAAFLAGCPFVDFTPSTGARLPALDELAHAQGVPYAGSDGKTGETLVKSVLAPMFSSRALQIRAWSGTNLLGGGDGATLADPDAAESKIDSKQRILTESLRYEVGGDVHIHNVPELGDWKTAWDHIAFDGFLGVRMTMQFTWQGCDSALAAPLVLDLARFTARAHEAGCVGALPELGFFFKDPVGSTEHALAAQFEILRQWAAGLVAGR